MFPQILLKSFGESQIKNNIPLLPSLKILFLNIFFKKKFGLKTWLFITYFVYWYVYNNVMLYYKWQVEILTMTNLQTKCSFTYPEKNWPIFMGNLKLQILCGSVLCKRIILVNKVKLLTIWRLNVRQIRLIIQIYLKEAYRLVFQIFTGSIIDYKCGECLPEPNPSNKTNLQFYILF